MVISRKTHLATGTWWENGTWYPNHEGICGIKYNPQSKLGPVYFRVATRPEFVTCSKCRKVGNLS